MPDLIQITITKLGSLNKGESGADYNRSVAGNEQDFRRLRGNIDDAIDKLLWDKQPQKSDEAEPKEEEKEVAGKIK